MLFIPKPSPQLFWAVTANVAAALPIFMLGAMSADVGGEFAVGPEGLGLAAAVFFLATGLLVAVAGRLIERRGARWGMVMAACLSAASLLGVALSWSFGALLTAVAIGGMSSALAQPAVNQGIATAASLGGLGTAFGMKQSAIPFATLLSGLVVPAVGTNLGWRWPFLGAAILCLWVAVNIPTYSSLSIVKPGRKPRPSRSVPRNALLVLTVGAALGSAASITLGIFLVSSGVARGFSTDNSALLFATCSGLGLVSRIGLGWGVDRRQEIRLFVLVSGLLFGGFVGFILLAVGNLPLFVLGAALGYGAGWAWQGIFEYALVRTNLTAASSVTGVVQTGLCLGAAFGPLAFGVVVDASSYRVGWLVNGGIAGAAVMMVGLGHWLQSRANQT